MTTLVTSAFLVVKVILSNVSPLLGAFGRHFPSSDALIGSPILSRLIFCSFWTAPPPPPPTLKA